METWGHEVKIVFKNNIRDNYEFYNENGIVTVYNDSVFLKVEKEFNDGEVDNDIFPVSEIASISVTRYVEKED